MAGFLYATIVNQLVDWSLAIRSIRAQNLGDAVYAYVQGLLAELNERPLYDLQPGGECRQLWMATV
jgi:hypothetical protein